MRWRKCDLWKAGIVMTSMLLLLLLMMWVPRPAASAHEETSGLATLGTVTVQATPTEDATVTALNKEHLTQEVAGQQHTWDNWLWSNAATILSSFLSTLVIVVGALFGLWRWRTDRRDAQDKELKDRQNERDKRAEERFQAAVTGLGDDKEGARIGAAILLRTFLRPGYEQFYTQTFDLAAANLRLPRTSQPPADPDTPLPLTTLSQALIVVFKEALPLARGQVSGSNPPFVRGIQSLDATGIQLDNAYLRGTDLNQVRMPEASLRKVNLKGATLSGADLFKAKLCEASLTGADLSNASLIRANLFKAWFRQADLSEADLTGANFNEANLSGAILSKVNLEDALSLKDTNLRGVIGLTKEQLAACKAKGAIIDEDPTTSTFQSAVAPLLPELRNDTQTSSASLTQENLPTPDTDGSNAVSSQPASES